MVQKLVNWALNSPLIVILLVVALAAVGGYAFINVNVEAYPDPAPAIIEVIAQYPGASAEEVERQVTIPLEVTLAGMPGLKYTRSKSLFGLSHLRNQFDYGIDFYKARQEVINRLQFVDGLPAGVNPQISPQSPTGEILRYTLRSPKDARGRDIYTLNDLKALQDWTLERVFRRVPRIADIVSSGGTVKRYEVRPEPDRLLRYGITLPQLQAAIANSNTNTGGNYLAQGQNLLNVRGLGLIGAGLDPMQAKEVLGTDDPQKAADFLRHQEDRRIKRVRQTIITSVNNMPVRVEDLVEGGPLHYPGDIGREGVIVAHQARLGKVSLTSPKRDANGNVVHDEAGNVVWQDEDEKVQGIVLLRKNEDSLPALHDVEAKIRELNENPDRLLPGVKIEPYYDRSDLIHITTETVRENLVLGMVLVTVILMMFLSNVRSAIIVAINIPLALLFAFSILYFRGRSANLLSIGAVDFGIIVDSSVIMVENIYRNLAAGAHPDLPIKQRILLFAREIDRALLFSTCIMVCAFIPLFTMSGPEGQLFAPMADTYAFSLAGALMLAVTLTPVMCMLLFKNFRPVSENFLVRFLKSRYLWQLGVCLKYRWTTIVLWCGLVGGTAYLIPHLGREFMPELEEGNLWVRATFPVNIALDAAAEKTQLARSIMCKYPEVEVALSQAGRPDDGTDPCGFYNVEFFVPLKPFKDWLAVKPRAGWRTLVLGDQRPRSKVELIEEMSPELKRDIVGVNWNFSQNIRYNVMESLSGVKGDNSVKIFGPDLDELERIAKKVEDALESVRGIKDVGVFRIKGQSNLEFPVDEDKCNKWGVSVADVQNVVQTAIGGKAFSQMIEGEKSFDITLRWPEPLRASEAAILNIPVDVANNQVTPGFVPGVAQTPHTGPSTGVSTTGSSATPPALTGSQFGANYNNLSGTPRRRLVDLVTPLNSQGETDAKGKFIRAGASTIYREQGNRMIAIKFSVRGRDLAGAVSEAQKKTAELLQSPYRAVWSGEFEEMEEAEHRLMFIIPLSLGLIFILLYMAFHSFIDAFVVFSNVFDLAVGGIWALYVTGTNFSISAAVGFVSLFGVAIMEGLLMISYFNALRAQGLPVNEAIIQGAAKRVRPVMITAMTAILGLLPAALSTKIGSQTQRPLAIVVVGGMIMTLFLDRYMMPVLYSFYGHRAPPAEAKGLAH
jgi:cobalt-zinc-cadmium resistance protein CzcA